ncbi:LysR family transcriptional regulator [Halobacillus sp. BBL2006]|uniref:LysR family transcriptional regulator n=1 Tax=Halobacillus sp. BBL2006 TaxID=1543706 RepID=UPI000543F5F9|nr:LysR family transcriptional regulator [Halobacillus sp. BBL2006]KHE72865.1 LysR family transcriptional regulator [Halobacillus sp. BBL2006]
MDLSYLYTFKEVARWGSYTRTGEELGYAQSSVTTQIKKLEEHYKVKLFERVGQKMRLTQSGEELLYYVQQVINLMDEAEIKVSQTSNMRGTIRIGTVESLAAYYITGILKLFKKENPNMKIQLESGLCPNLLEGILESHYDLAVVLDEPIKHPNLTSISLRKEKMFMVASPQNHLAADQNLDIGLMEDETLILTEKDCSYRKSLEKLLKAKGIQARSVISFSSLEAIKQCVVDELGIAMLPEMTVKEDLKNGRLARLDFDYEDFGMMIQLVYQKRKWLSPSLEEFIKLMTDEVTW